MNTYRSDVIIHIDELLQDHEIHALERDLGHIDGVYSACVNDRARHLLLVDYDPEDVRAAHLLEAVRRRGVGAELVGL